MPQGVEVRVLSSAPVLGRRENRVVAALVGEGGIAALDGELVRSEADFIDDEAQTGLPEGGMLRVGEPWLFSFSAKRPTFASPFVSRSKMSSRDFRFARHDPRVSS